MSNLILKRAIFGGALLLLLAFLGQALWVERYPPEVRVRMALQKAAGAFNEEAPSAARFFAKGYQDEGGYGRQDVKNALRWLQATGDDYKIQLRDEDISVQVAGDRGTAQVQFNAAIWRNEEQTPPWWPMEGVLHLELRGRRDHLHGWRVVSSEGVNHHRRGR